MTEYQNFPWPTSYIALRKKGLFDKFSGMDPMDGSYLWLDDMEWMSTQELDEFEREAGQTDKIFPFAYTGAHDWWAFYVEPGKSEMPIALCLHDEARAEFYAPTFEAAMFRQILQFASITDVESLENGLDGARFELANWRKQLGEYFQPPWNTEIERLARLPLKKPQSFTKPSPFDCNVLITEDEAKDIFQQLVVWDRTDETFEWQEWATPSEADRQAFIEENKQRVRERFLTESKGPACPQCGKPIRTDKARQCFSCGAVWN
jgi:hypothetical protein